LHLDTGLNSLNNSLGGINKGELIVFGGRPGMGKTKLLVQIASYISKKNKVLYHSLELNTFSITNFFISCFSQVSLGSLASNQLSESEMQSVKESIEAMVEMKLLISSNTINSNETVFDFYSKLIDEQGVEVICIDYLQLFSNQSMFKSREFEIALFLRKLKNFAKEKEITFLITSQLNRAVEMRGGDRKPFLSDLRESGSIEEYADKVVFIYRPEYYQLMCDEYGNSTIGIVELIVAKNNIGKLDTVLLHSDQNFTRFSEDFTWKK
jgi:replicative DNA helicase